MATQRRDQPRTKPWIARRKRDGVEYVIGYFGTKNEAEEAERGFDSVWPRRRGWSKGFTREGRRWFDQYGTPY